VREGGELVERLDGGEAAGGNTQCACHGCHTCTCCKGVLEYASLLRVCLAGSGCSDKVSFVRAVPGGGLLELLGGDTLLAETVRRMAVREAMAAGDVQVRNREEGGHKEEEGVRGGHVAEGEEEQGDGGRQAVVVGTEGEKEGDATTLQPLGGTGGLKVWNVSVWGSCIAS